MMKMLLNRIEEIRWARVRSPFTPRKSGINSVILYFLLVSIATIVVSLEAQNIGHVSNGGDQGDVDDSILGFRGFFYRGIKNNAPDSSASSHYYSPAQLVEIRTSFSPSTTLQTPPLPSPPAFRTIAFLSHSPTPVFKALHPIRCLFTHFSALLSTSPAKSSLIHLKRTASESDVFIHNDAFYVGHIRGGLRKSGAKVGKVLGDAVDDRHLISCQVGNSKKEDRGLTMSSFRSVSSHYNTDLHCKENGHCQANKFDPCGKNRSEAESIHPGDDQESSSSSASSSVKLPVKSQKYLGGEVSASSHNLGLLPLQCTSVQSVTRPWIVWNTNITCDRQSLERSLRQDNHGGNLSDPPEYLPFSIAFADTSSSCTASPSILHPMISSSTAFPHYSSPSHSLCQKGKYQKRIPVLQERSIRILHLHRWAHIRQHGFTYKQHQFSSTPLSFSMFSCPAILVATNIYYMRCRQHGQKYEKDFRGGNSRCEKTLKTDDYDKPLHTTNGGNVHNEEIKGSSDFVVAIRDNCDLFEGHAKKSSHEGNPPTGARSFGPFYPPSSLPALPNHSSRTSALKRRLSSIGSGDNVHQDDDHEIKKISHPPSSHKIILDPMSLSPSSVAPSAESQLRVEAPKSKHRLISKSNGSKRVEERKKIQLVWTGDIGKTIQASHVVEESKKAERDIPNASNEKAPSDFELEMGDPQKPRKDQENTASTNFSDTVSSSLLPQASPLASSSQGLSTSSSSSRKSYLETSLQGIEEPHKEQRVSQNSTSLKKSDEYESKQKTFRNSSMNMSKNNSRHFYHKNQQEALLMHDLLSHSRAYHNDKAPPSSPLMLSRRLPSQSSPSRSDVFNKQGKGPLKGGMNNGRDGKKSIEEVKNKDNKKDVGRDDTSGMKDDKNKKAGTDEKDEGNAKASNEEDKKNKTDEKDGKESKAGLSSPSCFVWIKSILSPPKWTTTNVLYLLVLLLVAVHAIAFTIWFFFLLSDLGMTVKRGKTRKWRVTPQEGVLGGESINRGISDVKRSPFHNDSPITGRHAGAREKGLHFNNLHNTSGRGLSINTSSRFFPASSSVASSSSYYQSRNYHPSSMHDQKSRSHNDSSFVAVIGGSSSEDRLRGSGVRGTGCCKSITDSDPIEDNGTYFVGGGGMDAGNSSMKRYTGPEGGRRRPLAPPDSLDK